MTNKRKTKKGRSYLLLQKLFEDVGDGVAPLHWINNYIEGKATEIFLGWSILWVLRMQTGIHTVLYCVQSVQYNVQYINYKSTVQKGGLIYHFLRFSKLDTPTSSNSYCNKYDLPLAVYSGCSLPAQQKANAADLDSNPASFTMILMGRCRWAIWTGKISW